MTPQPTERHIQIGLECGKRWIDEGGTVGDVVAQVLAKYFPDPQPTTERPTEEGWYWWRHSKSDNWTAALVGREPNGHLLNVKRVGYPGWLLQYVTGEWCPMILPSSPAEKGE